MQFGSGWGFPVFFREPKKNNKNLKKKKKKTYQVKMKSTIFQFTCGGESRSEE